MSIESVMSSNHLMPSPPSPPSLNLSHHQGLFKWVSSLHQMAKIILWFLKYQNKSCSVRYWNPEERELICLGESEIFNKKNTKFLKSNNSKQNILGRGHIHKDCMIFSQLLEQYLKGRMVDGRSWELSISLDRKGTHVPQNRVWSYTTTDSS